VWVVNLLKDKTSREKEGNIMGAAHSTSKRSEQPKSSENVLSREEALLLTQWGISQNYPKLMQIIRGHSDPSQAVKLVVDLKKGSVFFPLAEGVELAAELKPEVIMKKILEHKDSSEAALAICLLRREKPLFTAEYIELALKHSNPPSAARILLKLKEETMLESKCVQAILNHSNPEDALEAFMKAKRFMNVDIAVRLLMMCHNNPIAFVEAFVALMNEELMTLETMDEIMPIVNSDNSGVIVQALRELKKADLLTSQVTLPVLNHSDPEHAAQVCLQLKRAEKLDQSNLKLALEHANHELVTNVLSMPYEQDVNPGMQEKIIGHKRAEFIADLLLQIKEAGLLINSKNIEFIMGRNDKDIKAAAIIISKRVRGKFHAPLTQTEFENIINHSNLSAIKKALSAVHSFRVEKQLTSDTFNAIVAPNNSEIVKIIQLLRDEELDIPCEMYIDSFLTQTNFNAVMGRPNLRVGEVTEAIQKARSSGSSLREMAENFERYLDEVISAKNTFSASDPTFFPSANQRNTVAASALASNSARMGASTSSSSSNSG